MIISIHFIEFLFLITCWFLCWALHFSNATARSVVEHMKNSISCFRSSVSWTRSLALRDRRQFRTKNQQTGHFPCSGSQSKGIICVYFHHRSEFPVLLYRLNINIILYKYWLHERVTWEIVIPRKPMSTEANTSSTLPWFQNNPGQVNIWVCISYSVNSNAHTTPVRIYGEQYAQNSAQSIFFGISTVVKQYHPLPSSITC